MSSESVLNVSVVNVVDSSNLCKTISKEITSSKLYQTVTTENPAGTSNQGVNLSAEDYMDCPECGKILPVWDMPEHSDYHFALNLQNTVPLSDNNHRPKNTPNSGYSSKNIERKSVTVKKGDTSRNTNMSMLSFFQKK